MKCEKQGVSQIHIWVGLASEERKKGARIPLSPMNPNAYSPYSKSARQAAKRTCRPSTLNEIRVEFVAPPSG
jgi:hypothetical protein